MISLDSMASGTSLSPDGFASSRGSAFITSVGDAVEARLNPAAANAKIHGTIFFTDTNISEGERLSRDEFFHFASVARAVRSEVDCV